MAITSRSASVTGEGAPRVVAAHRYRTGPRTPATRGEAVELADLAQALVGDKVDPAHHTFAVVWSPAGEKLVRDGIPDVIRGKDLVPVVRPCADRAEYRRRLIEKAVEEIGEYRASLADAAAGDLFELADLVEVVDALAVLDGYSFDDVLRAKTEKRAERGGFADGAVWCGNINPPHPVV